MRTRRLAFPRSRRPRRRPSPRDQVVDLQRYRGVISEWSAFEDACSRPEPTVLRVRTGKISETELVARLTRQGFKTSRIRGMPSFLRVDEGPRPVSLTLEHWLGLFYVQQASTGVAAPALGVEGAERVMDLCAAPGGKTTHAAELMGDGGCLVACEISESRIRGLLGNVYRLGHPNIVVVAADGRRIPEGPLFDRVLVDAPCSGEGTLRRRGGRAPRQSRSFLGYVTRAQRELLSKAIRLTRPGGTILYVTCTFAPEENEAVLSDILGREPVEILPLDLDVPHAPGLSSFEGSEYDPRVRAAARIYPHHLDSGGLFLAKLRKLGRGDDEHGPMGWGAGWSSVPSAFPEEVTEAGAADRLLAHGLEEVCGRFGLAASSLDDMGWIVRGGRAWMHSVQQWPLDAWSENGWRTVSIGLRAIEFDSRGRARPTNDFLRWVDRGVSDRVVQLASADLARILEREPVPVGEETRGPVAIRLGSTVVGWWA